MALIRFKQIEKNWSGDVSITGSLSVYGSGTFVQSSSIPALIVSGSQSVVATSTRSGSVYIQGLGTLADTGSNQTVDLGDNSY